MVQILERPETFSSMLAKGLGAGVGSGLSQVSQFAQQMLMNRLEQQNKLRLAEAIEKGEYGTPSASERLGGGTSPQLSETDTSQGTPSISGRPSMEPRDSFAKAKAYEAAGLTGHAKIASEEAKVSEKRKMAQEEREYLPKKEYEQHAAKRNIQYLDEVGQIEKDLPSTEFSLGMIEDALGDANKWAAAKDWMAEHTGFAGFRSAAGAELDSAIKNYFLGDLTSIKGGRANVFLEKQIRDAYMRAGQDPISNQKILLGMKLKESINRLRVEKTRELENKFIKDLGYLPSDFTTKVNNSIKSEASKLEKDAIDTLHNISKVQGQRDKLFRSYLKSGETLMMSPEGEPFAVRKSEVKMYREQGYIPMGEK